MKIIILGEAMLSMLFRRVPDYNLIFRSDTAIYRHIYEDRSKTASILNAKHFLNAWMSSNEHARVTAIIYDEAERGDLPSIKQMIWLSDVYYRKAQTIQTDSSAIIEIKVDCLLDRIKFSEKATLFGADRSYVAMIAYKDLFEIRSKRANIGCPEMLNTLDGMLRNANSVLANNAYGRGFHEDARNIIGTFSSLRNLYAAALDGDIADSQQK